MKRGWQTVVMLGMSLGMSLVSWQAAASDSAGRPPSPKRLMVACMTKQMSASKTLSYNEATKLCKAQLQSQNATLASSTVKPMSGLNR
ncbi:MAG: hypothetical protein M3O41_12295 [Pseudomonadota bacterium]|nr:hypothetical protein [Pseudomonadota bacterium]